MHVEAEKNPNISEQHLRVHKHKLSDDKKNQNNHGFLILITLNNTANADQWNPAEHSVQFHYLANISKSFYTEPEKLLCFYSTKIHKWLRG